MEEKIREQIMVQWDYWREQIANGNVSSMPRDWFESILIYCEEELTQAQQENSPNW